MKGGLPTSNKFYGLDEVDPDAEHTLDYIVWRQVLRSPGYLERMAGHEVRTEVKVVPYG